MSKLRNLWRRFARWLFGEPTQIANPSLLSSRAYMREWQRRQGEALRKARERQNQVRKR
jgi:hypothetical protein